MTSEQTANAYWLTKSGAEYELQQQHRLAAGNASYAAQEKWLVDYLEALRAEYASPLRVLDFGCGFGRFARLLAGRDDFDYHGYDASRQMVEPLLSDPAVAPKGVAGRIRVAPELAAAFPGDRFDVVFTVSVLIHNPPEVARALLEDMSAALAPGGRIVLVENAVSALSMRENSWHSGCWIHDVGGTLARDHSVEIFPDAIPHHAVYVLTSGADARHIRWHPLEGASREISLDELHLAGLSRSAQGLAGLEQELSVSAAERGADHDQAELGRLAAEDVQRLSAALETTNQQVAQLRAGAEALEMQLDLDHRALVEATARADLHMERARAFEESLALRLGLREVLSGVRFEEKAPHRPAGARARAVDAEDENVFEINAPRDLAFANVDPRFGRVAQVFHQEWIGIRAAAGSLPGTKLAIKSARVLSPRDMEDIATTFRSAGVDRVVLHGMSDAMQRFARALKRAMPVELHVVWHGSPAMWLNQAERDYFKMAITLLHQGVVRRFHGIRRGMEPVINHAGNYSRQLLNPPPMSAIKRIGPPRTHAAIAFAPSWNLLHKNLGTNIAAAVVAGRVGEIWGMAQDGEAMCGKGKRFRRIRAGTPLEMMQTMASADIVLNVSLVDCHPMVDMEALSVGTPCLRGPLFLDALEDHPYVRATEVANVLSVVDIAAALDRVLETPPQELSAAMADYAEGIRKISLDRYVEFLGL